MQFKFVIVHRKLKNTRIQLKKYQTIIKNLIRKKTLRKLKIYETNIAKKRKF